MASLNAPADGKPLISVVIPTYNIEAYIGECLESVMGQTYTNIEVIVVDDGSTDETASVVSHYASEDNRISLFTQNRGGAGAARNVGLSHASGIYLLFFDGDDIMSPFMIEKMWERAFETGADITVCRSISFDERRPNEPFSVYRPGCADTMAVVSGESYGVSLFSSFIGWPWDKLLKSSFVHAHDLRFQELFSTNDAFFVYVSLALAKSIALVPNCFVRHRLHEASIESSAHFTPHNTLKAFRAIESRLRSENVDSEVLQSCINWGYSQLRWAFQRFSGDVEAQNAVAEDYMQLASELSNSPDEYYLHAVDVRLKDACIMKEERSAEVALYTQALEIDKLTNELAIAREDLEWYREQLENRDRFIQSIKQSPSFRIGRALTAAPRAVRDRVHHES